MKRLAVAALLAVVIHGLLFFIVKGDWLKSRIPKVDLDQGIAISLEKMPAPPALPTSGAVSAISEPYPEPTGVEEPALSKPPEAEPSPVPAPRQKKIETESSVVDRPVPEENPEEPMRKPEQATEVPIRQTPDKSSEEANRSERGAAPDIGVRQTVEAGLEEDAVGTADGTEAKRSTEGAVTLAVPLYDVNPPPLYPRLARKRGYEGTVLLHVMVDKRGRAAQVEIGSSSGYGILDRTATDAVRNWLFQPGMRQGVPATMWVDVPVRFQLK